MRKLLLIVLLLFAIVGCRNGGESGDTGTDQTSGIQQGEVVEDTPRIENTPVPPTPTSLPATLTPAPVEIPEHINPATPRLIHVIQPGDTLSEIAVQYNVTVDAISDANRHYNFDLIYAGDWIYIPECLPEQTIRKDSLNLISEGAAASSAVTATP